MVSSARIAPAATLRKAAHIQRLLEPGAIQPVYQPIVRLTDLEPVGYEGLARFPYVDGLSHLPPDVTLAAAGEIGLRQDLEVACWAAMATAGSPPNGRLLFVNISPDALSAPGLLALADKLPSRLVIEITEQREVQDYAQLREQLAPWVARGAAIAIDDTGAGYASLEHVVELRPDFLKLTRGLVSEIDKDATRQALLRALGAFAREVGAVIVAEGVERREELAVLREAEVDFAQGWLFGKPGPAWPEISELHPSTPKPQLTDSGIRRITSLERDLAGAPNPTAACRAATEHLSRIGFMPSVYLEQGGRLRCQTARGYWMVYDGMPQEAGVIGRTFRSGETQTVSDVQNVGEYLSMVTSVKAEIAVPLKVADRTVGVINVESATPMGDGPKREIERVAGLLSRRLTEMGPLDKPTPGQRLARAAARTVGLVDTAAIIREVVAAAIEVSGAESAAVVAREQGEPLQVHFAAGVFADPFNALSPTELEHMGACVEQCTTTVTTGDGAGKGPTWSESLRRAGAGAMVMVPLQVAGDYLGFIAIADRSNMVFATEDVELLELLGTQAAAQLRGVSAANALRDRAARDALTGLGHHATFHSNLPQRRAEASADGRQLAVVIADVDGLDGLNERRGHSAGDQILRQVAELLEEVAPGDATAFRLGGDEFALLMTSDGRGDAQQVAWDLQAQARERLGATLSIGVALAVDGEADEDLLARADSALYEVKRRGRDGVALAGSKLRAVAERNS